MAYPMQGAAVAATLEFLQSAAPKRGHNIKFESRWTQVHLKTRVRKWAWDSMQAAHVLDNRTGVSGLKFQAFVRLGFPEYDMALRPYMEPGRNGLNRLSQVPMRDLLHYCALDSLLEWKLSELQIPELKGVARARPDTEEE
jgi:hypothetical protein